MVRRRDPDLWAMVLDPENSYRRQLIDQVSVIMKDVSKTIKFTLIQNKIIFLNYLL